MTRKKKVEVEKPELSNEDQIFAFIQCGLCVEELLAAEGPEVSPRDYARLEAGWTPRGLQIRCVRHECNVLNIDFEGCQHPADVTRKVEIAKEKLQ